ncbi:cytochrome c [Methylomicrobium lacus]|uniref:c-type cytochrome n=1 Tax=Methylomicrobium lacus TaxID=136992 RepID=UPI0035A99A30
MRFSQGMTLGMIVLWAAMQAASAEAGGEGLSSRIGSGNPAAGKDKSDAGRCQECHGVDGNSGDPRIPNHAGQHAGYLAKQLFDFQTGTRQHEVMSVMAEDLDAADIADIAAYFAAQKPMRGRDGSGKAAARPLFEHGDASRKIPACAECHGSNGEGRADHNGSVVPVLGGQRKVYLRAQLVSWKLGERNNSPDGVMNEVAKRLSDDEIDALADYLSGLQPP